MSSYMFALRLSLLLLLFAGRYYSLCDPLQRPSSDLLNELHYKSPLLQFFFVKTVTS